MISIIVPAIVIAIICLQIYFFKKNIKRMDDYSRIFEKPDTWSILHNVETNFVSGISGSGNGVFLSIKTSINKYLRNNSGSIIDFQLLKDAVDRHCDSVENDVNTLTPIPLYCGLAGTMAGVIVGLASLLSTGSITALLSSGSSDFGSAANGVNDLLSGVAWAMLASICGLVFTTVNSIMFKRRKIQGEAGKNTFLAWLQATLLPELPSDTSDALNRLVVNLNAFNDTFEKNTQNLGSALSQVNESYQIQGQIIQAVHDMDVMKMAKANVRVLEQLSNCTDKLELFNEYLDRIHGYTDVIQKFVSLFNKEASRLHVLEEIKEFLKNHNGEIKKNLADSDLTLREAMDEIKDNAEYSAKELNKTLIEQNKIFKEIIDDERDTFEKLNKEIAAKFDNELSKMPTLQKQLSEISGIPAKLDNLISRMEGSNRKLVKDVASTMEDVADKLVKANSKSSGGLVGGGFPNWMRWTIVASAVIVALACVGNTVHSVWYADAKESQEVLEDSITSSTTPESIVMQEQGPATVKHGNNANEGLDTASSVNLGK